MVEHPADALGNVYFGTDGDDLFEYDERVHGVGVHVDDGCFWYVFANCCSEW